MNHYPYGLPWLNNQSILVYVEGKELGWDLCPTPGVMKSWLVFADWFEKFLY